ncbi:hypothetical protein ACXR0O_07280 [Verrucomicrobiota bacterium sgz303538]
MVLYPGIAFLTVLPLLGLAGENPSALAAIKALPKQEVENLALIAAYGGTSDPERWHFVVYDANAPSGVREYVVEGGKLVTARGVSQFAEKVTKADVIENRVLRIDSDQLAKLAKDYAAANNIAVNRIGYQLVTAGAGNEPVWRITCVDQAEKPVGALVVAAVQGNVISHEGFAVQPKVAQIKPQDRDPDEKRSGTSKSVPASESVAAAAAQKKATASTSKRRSSSPDYSSRRYVKQDVRQPAPQPPPPVAVRRPINPIGNLFRKLLAR